MPHSIIISSKNKSSSLVIIVKSVESYPSIDRNKIYPLFLGKSKEHENIITASSYYNRKNFRVWLTFLKGQLLQYM